MFSYLFTMLMFIVSILFDWTIRFAPYLIPLFVVVYFTYRFYPHFRRKSLTHRRAVLQCHWFWAVLFFLVWIVSCWSIYQGRHLQSTPLLPQFGLVALALALCYGVSLFLGKLAGKASKAY